MTRRRRSSRFCASLLLRFADVIGDAAPLQKVENVRSLIHAARLERTSFLGEIEQRNVLERDVIEIEVAAKAQPRLDETWKAGGETSSGG